MDRTTTLLTALALLGAAAAEPLKMTPPASESGNTYARAMSAALSHLGPAISYDRVMGLSGVAFILQVDTSGPYLPGHELDCAWWPNDAWGFELGLPLLSQATGWEIRRLTCDLAAHRADSGAEFRRALLPAVEPALRAGRPVLAQDDHCFVITGTDGGEPAILGYGTKGHATNFGAEVVRAASYPWGLYVFGERQPAADARQVDTASLRHIIALHEERAQGADAPKTRFSGRQAWAEWLRLLHADQAADNNMLIHLRYDRASAVVYLHEMAQRQTGAAGAHLTAATALYQQVLTEALGGELPHPGPTKGGRAGYTAMVERIAALEDRAVAQLKEALASL
ncbi:MAG: hypothetical protein HZB16_13270 [Armatimonadetes bacterium]|nr:hypothetical protein [Armatimonadota bacterium]